MLNQAPRSGAVRLVRRTTKKTLEKLLADVESFVRPKLKTEARQFSETDRTDRR